MDAKAIKGMIMEVLQRMSTEEVTKLHEWVKYQNTLIDRVNYDCKEFNDEHVDEKPSNVCQTCIIYDEQIRSCQDIIEHLLY